MPGQVFKTRIDCFGEALALITGVGPVNAALAVGRVLAGHENISGVVNIGVAGTYDEQCLPLLATTTANTECWPDYGLAGAEKKDAPDAIDPQGIGLPLGRLDNTPVFDRLELHPDEAAARMGLCLPPDWLHCVSVTVAAASGTRQRADALRQRYASSPGRTEHTDAVGRVALTENMEGFALAWACALAGIPFLEVRTVSNLVGSREPAHWRLKEAVAGLGGISRALLAQPGAAPRNDTAFLP